MCYECMTGNIKNRLEGSYQKGLREGFLQVCNHSLNTLEKRTPIELPKISNDPFQDAEDRGFVKAISEHNSRVYEQNRIIEERESRITNLRSMMELSMPKPVQLYGFDKLKTNDETEDLSRFGCIDLSKYR